MSKAETWRLLVVVHLGDRSGFDAEPLAAREALLVDLNRLGGGQFAAAGEGPGTLRFSAVVPDQLRARRQISELLGRHFPDRPYSVAADVLNANMESDGARTASSGRVCLSVEIPLSGDGFPNQSELGARNSIIDELDRRKIGGFVGAGGGMGAMDFAYVVDNEPYARAQIVEVVKRRLPGVEFTIDVGSADDIDIEEDDSEGGTINWPRLIGCLVILVVVVAGIAWLIWSIVT